MSRTGKIIRIEQTGSPIRRHHTQRATVIGLGLNRIGRVAEVPDTAQVRGMSLPIWIAVGMTLVLAVVAIARRRRAPLDRSGGAL